MTSPSTANPAVSGGSRAPARIGTYGIFLIGVLLLLAAGLTYYGAGFYALDVQERVDHPQFRTLSPSGSVGHGYGIAGTLLILTNLLYLLRRRFARMRFGSMRRWLDIHVFTGLFGSVLIVYHSAFQLRSGIAGLTAISLALVVASGIIGRYFYALNPGAGEARLRASVSALHVAWPALAEHLWQVRQALPAPTVLERPTLVHSLACLPRWLGEARARRRAIRAAGEQAIASAALSAGQRKALRKQVALVALYTAAEAKAVAGDHLLRTWRGLHRMMAVLMVVSVTVHISVAWYFGFRWLWSS